MPYSIGEKGSYGCSGYPVVKDGTSDVMGCHETAASAQAQISAINISEAESSKKKIGSGVEGFDPAATGPSVLDGARYEEKDTVTSGGGVGLKNPQAWPGTRISEEERRRKKEKSDVWSGSFSPTLTKKSNYNDNTGGWLNAKPITETSAFQNEIETRNSINREIGKEQMEIKEGDFVMGPTVDGMVFGRVEHIMWEGGTLGEAGTEYALESMPPENPAMSVRVFEVEENEMEATPYSIGMMYQDAQVVDVSSMTMEQENEMEMMSKAETYSPSDGMKSAARRAIKWREDGEATGAGTPVGWGRARDIVAGRSMSLSVVRRMFSFFSRHEVDKQAKGFSAGEEGYPSNGRIMWDAWGGDAGFSWSRAIVERNREKSLGSDIFGFTNVSKVKEEYAAKRERSMETRRRLAESGQAMPDGSYPIVTEQDLRNAIQAFGRTDNPQATKEHIMRRARALGRTDLIPENWTGEKFWDIRDLTKTQNFVVKADSVRVGQMVSWNSSGGRAQGKVTRVIRSGSYNVPNSEFVINGTEENPAVVITLYRDGKPTDTTVAHRMSTLRAI